MSTNKRERIFESDWIPEFESITIAEAQNKLVNLEEEIAEYEKDILFLKICLETFPTSTIHDSIEQEKLIHQCDQIESNLRNLSRIKKNLEQIIKIEEEKLIHPGYKQVLDVANDPRLHEALLEYTEVFYKPKKVLAYKTERRKFLVFPYKVKTEYYKELPFEIKISDVSPGNPEPRYRWYPARKWVFRVSICVKDDPPGVPSRSDIYIIWRDRKTEIGGLVKMDKENEEDRQSGLSIEGKSFSAREGSGVFYSLDGFCSFIARCIARDEGMGSRKHFARKHFVPSEYP